MDSTLAKSEPQEIQLLESEQKALEEWQKTGEHPLALAVNLKLYELYLNFYSLDEIYRINGRKIPLGQIVDARVRFEWDKRRNEQLAHMYGAIEQKVLKTKHDAVNNVVELLSAAHKIWGDKIKKFLETGDQAALGDLKLDSFKNYRDLLEAFKMLTERKEVDKNVNVGGVVSHVHSIKETHKMSSETASNLLKLLDDKSIIDVK